MPMTLVVPLPPNLANGRMHWRVTNARRREYFEAVDMLALIKRIPPPPPMPFPKVTIAITLYLGAFMDDDNALSRCKWPIDWLVRRDYIAGDARKHCRLSIPNQKVKRNGVYAVELIVTPVESETKAPASIEG